MDALNFTTPVVRRVAYDAENGTLRVTFRHSDIAECDHVPEVLVQAWMISRHPDDFFDRKIREKYCHYC